VTRLLVVAPDRELTAQLSFAGYQVASATTGAGALRLLGEHHVDLIVVDIEIPDLMALARNRPVLTERPPVLCVTACEFLGTLVPSLGSEIEDYVTKPFHRAELLARVEVLLRGREKNTLRYDDLLLDEITCQGWRGDRALELTPAEYRLLRHLMQHAGQVLSKEQVARHVWQDSRGDNAIERLISRLRQKLSTPELVHTHRGFGYLLK
jgi:DNA-binding response OmpR family regulator